MSTTSWVLREKVTKKVVMETFDPRAVAALNTRKYEAVPIYEYLVELNATIRAANAAAAPGSHL